MSWESYAAMLTNTLDPDTNEYTVTGVGTHGAIYGLDGTKYGCTPGFELYAYEFEIDVGDGTTKKADINEVDIALGLFKGQTKGGDAGIRLGNTKFMFLRKEDGKIYLSKKGGGGAIIAEAKKTILIAVWDPNNADSNGLPQNPGDVLKNVEILQEYLKTLDF